MATGTRSRYGTRGSLNGRTGSHNRMKQAATKRTGYGLSRSSRQAKTRVTHHRVMRGSSAHGSSVAGFGSGVRLPDPARGLSRNSGGYSGVNLRAMADPSRRTRGLKCQVVHRTGSTPLDLEDAVPAQLKDRARSMVAEVAATRRCWVRVNRAMTDDCVRDLGGWASWLPDCAFRRSNRHPTWRGWPSERVGHKNSSGTESVSHSTSLRWCRRSPGVSRVDDPRASSIGTK